MIKVTARGPIHSISPVLDITSRSGSKFQKRELVIDDSWVSRDGVAVPNYILIEFGGDKMSLLNNFVPGQLVQVEAIVNGREWNGKVIHSFRGQSVIFAEQQQGQQGQPQPQPQQPQQAAYQPQPQPQPMQQQQPYPQQPQAPQQPYYGYPQQPQQPQQWQPMQPQAPQDPSLPF